MISTVDALKGAKPYVHTQCTIVKVHGDYLDIQFRNIESELNTYPAELDAYLDRLFTEHNLIIIEIHADMGPCSARRSYSRSHAEILYLLDNGRRAERTGENPNPAPQCSGHTDQGCRLIFHEVESGRPLGTST